MRIFRASYRHDKGYSWEHYEFIVVAATMQDVLPDVMKEEPQTLEKFWTIIEIAINKHSCLQTYIGIY